jgi:hypothetical protein
MLGLTRLARPHELLLLAAGACVPLSLAFTAWPPPGGETIVVRELVPVVPCDEDTPEAVEPLEAEPPEPGPEPELESAEPDDLGERLDGPDFMWVTRPAYEGGGPAVVLALEPEAAWAAGAPRALAADGVVTRPVDETALPPALAAIIGQRVDLYASHARVCTAVVGAPQLIAEASGDLELLGSIDAGPYDDQPEPQRRSALATVVWEHGRQLLVAPLAMPPECGSGRDLQWARAHGAPQIAPLEPTSGGRPRATLARRFLAQPKLIELAELLEHDSGPVEGSALQEEDSSSRLRNDLIARRWLDGGEPMAVTVVTVGDDFSFEGCGFGVYPEWGIALTDGDGLPGPVHVGPYGQIAALFDLDGDGRLEVLVEHPDWGGRSLLTLTPEGLQPRSELEAVPFFGCPC